MRSATRGERNMVHPTGIGVELLYRRAATLTTVFRSIQTASVGEAASFALVWRSWQLRLRRSGVARALDRFERQERINGIARAPLPEDSPMSACRLPLLLALFLLGGR